MGLLSVNKGTEVRRTSTTASKSPEDVSVIISILFQVVRLQTEH